MAVPIYKAQVTRNEVNGEIYHRGELTFLEGLDQEQVDDLLAKGFYIIYGYVSDEDKASGKQTLTTDDEPCHGC